MGQPHAEEGVVLEKPWQRVVLDRGKDLFVLIGRQTEGRGKGYGRRPGRCLVLETTVGAGVQLDVDVGVIWWKLERQDE